MRNLKSIKSPPPSRKHARLNPPDAIELSQEKSTRISKNGIPADFGCIIDYENAEGERSSRRISIKNVKRGRYGKVYLNSYCYEAGAPRQFRADRVYCVYDVEDGEVISEDAEAFFAKYVLESKDPLRQTTITTYKDAYQAVYRQIKALSYIAQSDGEYSQKEKQIIWEYCERIFESENVKFQYERTVFEEYIAKQRISNESYLGYLDEIFQFNSDPDFVAAAILIVMSDDDIKNEEIKALESIEEKRDLFLKYQKELLGYDETIHEDASPTLLKKKDNSSVTCLTTIIVFAFVVIGIAKILTAF